MRPLVKSTPIEKNEEFEGIVQPYMHDLRSYCVSLTRSTWDGDDLMQETLTKTYKGWKNRHKQITKAYLFRIASNTWIDGYRKRKLNEEMNPDLSEFKQEENVISDVTFKAMEIMLSELTPKQRAAMLLAEAFGYTAREIASMIDVSEGAAKAALHRARRKLKRINYDSNIFYTEEEETLNYVTALRNGDSVAIVRLYQNEVNVPQMSEFASRRPSDPSVALQFIAGDITYVLVAIPMKSGGALYIPFYQLELTVLLSRLEVLRRGIPVAA